MPITNIDAGWDSFSSFSVDTNAAIQLGVAAFVRDADVVATRVMPGGGGHRLLGAGGEQEEAGEEEGFHSSWQCR